MSRRRFQYRVRSLLLVTVAVAAVFTVLGSQLAGRIQRRSDAGFLTDFRWCPVDFGTGASRTAAFVCATEDDARNLASRFDREEFCSKVNAAAGLNGLDCQPVLAEFRVNSGQFRNVFFIKYDFSDWGRYRLDARHVAYVFDSNDPAAKARNAAVHRAFQQAADAFAQANTGIRNWSHLP